jgi:DNA-binding response OmpR family regulator
VFEQRLIRLGAAKFMDKPFDFDALLCELGVAHRRAAASIRPVEGTCSAAVGVGKTVTTVRGGPYSGPQIFW